MTTYVVPGPLSAYVPAIQADIVVEYLRNEQDFPVNRYMGQRNVSLMTGFYRKLENNYQIRLPGSKLDRFTWADGAPNPAFGGSGNINRHAFLAYECTRYNFGTTIGWLTRDQGQTSGYDYLAQISRENSMLAMTGRTLRATNMLTTSGNYVNSNVGTMTAVAGGKVTAATSTNPYIRILIETCVKQIVANSNTSLRPKDIHMVFGPDVANAINQSQEWVDFVKQQPGVLSEFKGEGGYNDSWYLPNAAHGVTIDVEDSMINSVEEGAASQTRAFIWPAGTIVFIAKKNAIKPAVGSAFSSAEFFQFQPLTVETNDIPWDKRTLVDVVDNTAEQFIASETAYLVTACV